MKKKKNQVTFKCLFFDNELFYCITIKNTLYFAKNIVIFVHVLLVYVIIIYILFHVLFTHVVRPFFGVFCSKLHQTWQIADFKI